MKLFKKILLLLIITSCKGQVVKNDKLVNALANTKIEKRGNIVRIDASEYRLDYYDVHEPDSQYKLLASKGYQGGGPSWRGIIYGAIKLSDPEILNKIRFDDEAEGIAIWSSDMESLDKIGRLISVVKSDSKILTEAIKIAEEQGEME